MQQHGVQLQVQMSKPLHEGKLAVWNNSSDQAYNRAVYMNTTAMQTQMLKQPEVTVAMINDPDKYAVIQMQY